MIPKTTPNGAAKAYFFYFDETLILKNPPMVLLDFWGPGVPKSLKKRHRQQTRNRAPKKHNFLTTCTLTYAKRAPRRRPYGDTISECFILFVFFTYRGNVQRYSTSFNFLTWDVSVASFFLRRVFNTVFLKLAIGPIHPPIWPPRFL